MWKIGVPQRREGYPDVDEWYIQIVDIKNGYQETISGKRANKGPYIMFWKSGIVNNPAHTPDYSGEGLSTPAFSQKVEGEYKRYKDIDPYLPTEYAVITYDGDYEYQGKGGFEQGVEIYRGNDIKEAKRIYDAVLKEWGINQPPTNT